MTKKDQWPIEQAKEIAERVLKEIRPHCYRAEIAGSIRRNNKDFVGDIEIVIHPKPYDWGLMADNLALVVNQWKKVKGNMDGKTKYTQRILPEGIKLDLFFCEEENFGNTFATRTGSAGFSHSLAIAWVRAGFQSRNNYLYHKKTGQRMVIKEEIDLFNLIGKRYVEPEDRG